MAEVRDLDIILSDEGAMNSGGKSHNVWGNVTFPKELLKHINQSKKSKQKASVWTAFDDFIYSKKGEVMQKDLPRISATFKSGFNKYSAITENMGMKIAMAMDLPTSYNYIVKFDPKQYPAIVNNYPDISEIKKLQPLGIVSIDFLQLKKSKTQHYKSEIKNPDGSYTEIDGTKDIVGDELIPFDKALQKYHIGTNNLNGEDNLIENWIDSVDEIARNELKDCPKEYVNKNIAHIHSRIARSFLLREFLGDCDFASYNGGVVFNEETKVLRYAPNFDYGECFNALIQNKLDRKNIGGMSQETFDALPDNVKATILAVDKKRSNMTIDEIASTFASDTSEKNFKYVIKNFPDSSKEFFISLDKLIQRGEINDIVDSYANETLNGQPLLDNNERTIFKDYLTSRASHICELYVDNLKEQGKDIPQELDKSEAEM